MMDEQYEIKDLDTFLQECLGSDVKIVNIISKPLKLIYKSFGSEMLQLDVTIESKSLKKQESLLLVAKMSPRPEFFKQAYDIAATFKLEIHFYSNIVPTLQAFQQEQGVCPLNGYAKYYGSRISLDKNSNTVDDDGVLLLENLMVSGFSVLERSKGFDLHTTKLILKNLAILHATAIAFKMLRPEEFKTKILSGFIPSKMFGGVTKIAEEAIMNGIIGVMKTSVKCEPLIPNVIDSMKKCFRNLRNPEPPQEPFATVTQNDCWMDNLMFKIENGRAVAVKIVDFQYVQYASPARDLIELLFTSLRYEDFVKHYDSLLKFYYNCFVSTLNDLKCDSSVFTYELLLQEINYCATNTHFFCIMILLRHVLGVRKQGDGKQFPQVILTDEYKNKLLATILYFANNGWI